MPNKKISEFPVAGTLESRRAKGMKAIKAIIPLLLIILTCYGCQVGHELHFFKAGNNYYRLKVNESSFSAKARYVSGYYDDKAVDKYFSEMSQPKEEDAKKADSVSFMEISADGSLEEKKNRQLVMILSTNSDAITEQIGAFAENEQMLEMIARLANKDKIAESKSYKQLVEQQYQQNKSIVQLGNSTLESLSDDASVETTKNQIGIFLTNLKSGNSSLNETGIDILIREFEK